MLALTPSDIDFEASQIHITKSFGRVGGMDIINPPKTPQSNRVVTMPAFLADEIEECLRLHAKARPDARIFPTMTKHLLHHEMIHGAKKLTQALKAWSRALEDVESGKMTEAEYELWKASFRA